MANQISNAYNAYESTLTAAMTGLDDEMTVAAPGPITAITYLVLEPDDPAKREVVMVGSVVGSTFGDLTRYLAGSAAPSNLTHDVGAVVRSVAVQQMWEDVHDRIDFYSNHVNLSGQTPGDVHPQYVLESLVDGPGDLLVGESDGVVNRLPIGANEEILVADDAEVLGVRWTTHADAHLEVPPIASPNTVAFASLARSAEEWLFSGDVITWDVEMSDTDGFIGTMPVTVFTIPVGLGGVYQVQATATINLGAASVNLPVTPPKAKLMIYKNGSLALDAPLRWESHIYHELNPATGQPWHVAGIVLIFCHGIIPLNAGDSLSAVVEHNSVGAPSGDPLATTVGAAGSHFDLVRLGAMAGWVPS